MAWFGWAVAAALLSALNVWASKTLTKQPWDAVWIGAWVHLLGGLLALAALPWSEVRLSTAAPIWLGVLGMAGVYTLANVLYFKALAQTPLSEIDLYLRTSSLWTVLAGVGLLGEGFGLWGGLGAVLIVGSVLLVSRQRRLGFGQGQWLALGAALLFGLGNVVDKALSPHFDPVSYTALNLLLSGLGMLIFARRPASLAQLGPWGAATWAGAATFALTQFCLVLAYQAGGGAGAVILVAQARLVLLMAVGTILLGEREHLGRKWAAAMGMLLGIYALYLEGR